MNKAMSDLAAPDSVRPSLSVVAPCSEDRARAGRFRRGPERKLPAGSRVLPLIFTKETYPRVTPYQQYALWHVIRGHGAVPGLWSFIASRDGPKTLPHMQHFVTSRRYYPEAPWGTGPAVEQFGRAVTVHGRMRRRPGSSERRWLRERMYRRSRSQMGSIRRNFSRGVARRRPLEWSCHWQQRRTSRSNLRALMRCGATY